VATALRESSRVLAVRGRVLPASKQSVRLDAILEDGTVVEGESHIPEVHGRIRRVQLYPQDEQKLISFISRHKRQYTGMQLIQVLLPYMPLWRAGDLSKLITQLLAEHKIRPAQTLLWKGALTCEEKGDNKMISL